MWIILDVIVAAILVFFMVRGCKKGFIKSCLGLVVTLVSIIITINFYAPAGELIRDTVVYENLKNNLKATVENHIGSTDDADTVSRLFADAAEKLPEFNKLLKSFNVDGEKVAEDIDDAIKSGKEVSVDVICENIVEEAAVFISNAAAIIVVFLVSVLVLNLVILLLDFIFKLPVLNFANRVLGLLVGTAKGFFFACVIVAAIRVALPYLDGSGIKLTEADIERTVLFSVVDSINPLKF